MQGAEMLIPILVPLGAFAMAFGIYYLKTRENMAMIEKGLDPKLNQHRPAPFITLKWGLLLVGAGIGLMLAYFLTQYVLHDDDSPALWFALIGIGGGVGLISSYRIEKRELLDKENRL